MVYKVLLLVLALVACNEALRGRPIEGEVCHPDECVLEGYCLDYWWCERDESDHKGIGKNGTWKYDVCDRESGVDNMYWDPEHNGGACNWWENLSDRTKAAYNSDPTCIAPHCEWRADPTNECSGTYWYFHPDKNHGVEQELHCPSLSDGEQLLWSQARKSCHPCKAVHKQDGNACC